MSIIEDLLLQRQGVPSQTQSLLERLLMAQPDMASMLGDPSLQPEPPAMMARPPSIRGDIGDFVYDTSRQAGLGPSAQRYREGAETISDFIPGIGDAVGAQEAGQDYQAGNYGMAALGAGATALGAIPLAGPMAKGAMRGAKNVARRGADKIPSLTAAIWHNGKLYKGKSHLDALSKVEDTALRQKLQFDGTNRVFVTERGKILNQSAAQEYATSFGLLSKDAPEFAKTMPELNSEFLEKSKGIRAYQGSPHDFNAERLVRHADGRQEYIVGKPDVLPDVPAGAEVVQDFPMGRIRMDKIGTGEGAQAYGHGAYTAEREGIAKSYRDQLSDFTIDGKKFQWWNSDHVAATSLQIDGSKDAAIDGLTQRIAKIENTKASQKGFGTSSFDEEIDVLKDAVDKIKTDAPLPKMDNPGKMYEVNIDADPADFLDWDKPLSEQSEKVRGAVDASSAQMIPDAFEHNTGQEFGNHAWNEMSDFNTMTGRDVYGRLKDSMSQSGWDSSLNAASDELRHKGIPGIKYLDQGSRAAGEGSRNYVVFDENIISIIKKYGVAGAAAMLGMSQADLQQQIDEGA